MPINPNCCLCGLPYERIGNNPRPLDMTVGNRCCDACNEVVIQARINPAGFMFELERVERAISRLGFSATRQAAVAAICASRGPGLLAAQQRDLAKLRELEAPSPDDGSERLTPSQ